MSVEVSSNDRLLIAGSLVQETESAAWGTIHVVDGNFIVAVPQSDLLGVCGMPVEMFHFTLNVIPDISDNSSTALAFAWVCCVASDQGVTG